jgi:hypothetical protein
MKLGRRGLIPLWSIIEWIWTFINMLGNNLKKKYSRSLILMPSWMNLKFVARDIIDK